MTTPIKVTGYEWYFLRAYIGELIIKVRLEESTPCWMPLKAWYE
jgi:hypothetical protein